MRKKLIILIVSVIVIISVIIAGRYAFYQGYIRMNYPSFEEYPIQGIDISHHQIHIDWDNLDKEAVQFVFIKATEGGNHKDSLFSQNWEQAKKHNIPVSGYHFFTFCKTGKEQAQNFIESVPNDSTNLPPALDLEFGGNCSKENQVEDIIHEITEYINIIEQHYNKKVVLYSTNEFYKQYLTGQFSDNPIWIRDILKKPELPDNREWVFWQFANRGKLTGIDTYVDLNVFNGNKSDFEQFKNANLNR